MPPIFRVGPYSIYFWSDKNNPLWIQNVFWKLQKRCNRWENICYGIFGFKNV